MFVWAENVWMSVCQALSDNAVMALNGGAAMGGFYHNTGEGGISAFHKEPGGDIVWNVGTGYFGCRNEGKFGFLLIFVLGFFWCFFSINTSFNLKFKFTFNLKFKFKCCVWSYHVDGSFNEAKFTQAAIQTNIKMIEIKLSQG